MRFPDDPKDITTLTLSYPPHIQTFILPINRKLILYNLFPGKFASLYCFTQKYIMQRTKNDTKSPTNEMKFQILE